MYVLGIESSCDETGVAIYHSEKGLVAHALHSQITTHQPFGGVVPELASRDHVRQIIPLVEAALTEANLSKTALDAIAYTAGPGLVGALLTGACFAKSFAMALGKPSIAVHHLEAHILAAQLDNPKLTFPFLALLISGGHTQLIEARALGDYQLLGETLDDAAGEAFDKIARLMGLPYPGGAILARLADEATTLYANEPPLKPFPRPMTVKPNLNFSFSGLKTHAMQVWQNSPRDEKTKSLIAKAFQEAIVETLALKCTWAIKQTGYQQLVIAGGVSANRTLRNRLLNCAQAINCHVHFPRPEYCTDNGAMVAYAGFLYAQQGSYDSSTCIEVKARWPFGGSKSVG